LRLHIPLTVPHHVLAPPVVLGLLDVEELVEVQPVTERQLVSFPEYSGFRVMLLQ
jgi:hypothetical protein